MDFITIDEAIRQVPGGTDSLDTAMWMLQSICVALAIGGGYTASIFFADEDYVSGKLALLGSFLIGSAPHFARLFLFNSGT